MNQADNRQYHLDYLKAALTVLVICYHAGQPWALDGMGAYYLAGEKSRALGRLFEVNGSYFMGLFFLISGLFHPRSLDAKGPMGFTADRLARLGTPIVIAFFIIMPLIQYAYYINFRNLPPMGFWPYLTEIFLGNGPRPLGWTGSWPDAQLGPMWFVEHLMIYGLLYAAWRASFGNCGSKAPGPANRPLPALTCHLAIAAYVLALGLTTSLVWQLWKPNVWFAVSGVIQTEPARLPQYTSLFVVGLMAGRRSWLARLPSSVGYPWLSLGLLLALAGVADITEAIPDQARPFYEALLCAGFSVGLPFFFREHLWVKRPILLAISANAYPAYFIHLPVVVLLQYALGGLAWHPWVLFALVSILGVPLSFGTGHFITKCIPSANKVFRT